VNEALANPTTAPSAGYAHSAGSVCVDSGVRPPSSRIHAPAPLAFWHLASLDAPTVAVVWVLTFAWAGNVRLPAWTPILLALVTWTVYIADRLLDALFAFRNAQAHPLRMRHHFHWRHRRIFIPVAAVSACAAACIVVVFMPVAARERNSILAAAGLIYFSSVHAGRTFPRILIRILAPFVAKETLVAVIFTAACALPTLSRVTAHAPLETESTFGSLVFAIAYFTLLAWLNCHSIELWESNECNLPGDISSRSGMFFQGIVLGLAGLLLAVALASHQRVALLVASGAVAALLLALLDRFRGRLSPLALRAAADLVLLTPLPLLLR